MCVCVCGRIEQIFSQNCFGLNCLEMFLGAYDAIKKETFVDASRGGRVAGEHEQLLLGSRRERKP